MGFGKQAAGAAGDVDQLPPVGPGKVLSDVIQSGVVPGVDLREIFRQAQQSSIVRTAHAVNNGDFGAVVAGLPSLNVQALQVPIRSHLVDCATVCLISSCRCSWNILALKRKRDPFVLVQLEHCSFACLPLPCTMLYHAAAATHVKHCLDVQHLAQSVSGYGGLVRTMGC